MIGRLLLAITLMLVCISCQGIPPTAEELGTANFGAMPVDPEPTIRGFFDQKLKDPESAKYQVGTPIKGYYGKTLSNLAGPRNIQFGWLVPTKVNAKNGFGGYAGWHAYHCWFRGEELVNVIEPSKLLTQVENSAPIRVD